MAKYLEYGPIVKERYLPGVNAVYLFDPDDINQVLNEKGPGVFPQRRSHLALLKYRKDKPEVYKTGGLLPTNGQEWYGLRSELQKGLSSPANVKAFLATADSVVREFLDDRLKDFSFVPDFLGDLERLNLECKTLTYLCSKHVSVFEFQWCV